MFKIKLSPESRRQLDMISRELERLFRLPDRWLGEELQKLARRAREENPELLATRRSMGTYSDSFVWDVVPEVARRLGAKLSADEAQSHEFRSLPTERLREIVGTYLQNTSLTYGMKRTDLDWSERVPAIAILEHGLVNGNPLAFATDRLAAPAPKGEDGSDWLARHIREVGRYLDGQPIAAWSPECTTRAQAELAPSEAVIEIDLTTWPKAPDEAPELREPEVRYEGLLEFEDLSA